MILHGNDDLCEKVWQGLLLGGYFLILNFGTVLCWMVHISRVVFWWVTTAIVHVTKADTCMRIVVN